MVRSCFGAAVGLLALAAAVSAQSVSADRATAQSAAAQPAAATSSTALGTPVIQVHLGAVITPGSSGIANQTGSVHVGVAPVATARPVTFTVKNTGSADLTLADPIRLPRGFTLVRSFASHTLARGQATTFVVALNSARAGQVGGRISFGTNGAPGNQFSFTVNGTALGPPSMRIIDNVDPDFRTRGRWMNVTGRGFQGTIATAAAGRGQNQAVWTFRGLRPGLYNVSATWPAGSGQASNALFLLRNGTTTLAPVVVDQSANPSGLRDAGTVWQHLGGPYRLTDGTLTVSLSDQANGLVVADAVRIDRVGFPGQIIADGSPGFQTTGSWTRVGGQTLRATRPGSTATWTFSGLIPGHYRISVNWPANTLGPWDAQYAIHNGTQAGASATLNQQLPPLDLRDAGTTWADLGGLGNLFKVKGRTLVVRLSSPDSNGPLGGVLAGPMRIERIYDPAGGGDAGPLINNPDIVRLLEQSTWGPNDTSINHVQNDLGGDPVAFLVEQYYAPISTYPTPPLVLDNQTNQCNGDSICNRDNYSLYLVQNRFFTNAMYQPDQLRQRVAFALHEILVVSGLNVGLPMRYVPYLQIFDQNAFGNYRDILYQITLNPAMGNYLNMVDSNRSSPNENYGREIMQLFSIGLNFLNQDGTLQLDSDGDPIPTYTQDTVTNFARVFTGWTYASPPQPGTTNYIDPMVVHTPEATYHDRNAKTLLQYPNAVNPTLPPNQAAMDDLNQALDNIFYHPNVGPFICQQLIQKLVTSNPSPDYVARVVSAFNDDGTGVRGDLWAVVGAILLDPEARGDMSTDPNFGHVREPILYSCNVLRAFNATSYDGTTTSDGYINPSITSMGMDLFRPATVFSYYPPDFNVAGYVPLLGPEFGILNTVTTLNRANVVNAATFGGGIPTSTNAPYGTALNLTALQAMTPDAMADYLNMLLMHGTMSEAMQTGLIQAINAVAASNTLKRARTAVYLVTTAAQYQVQR
jgi:uncharacterized protein (DUF1800 family)